MATSPHVLALIERAKAAHAAKLATQAAAKPLGPMGVLAKSSAISSPATQTVFDLPSSNIVTDVISKQASKQVDQQATQLELNTQQALAVETGLRGQSFALIGAAGTGKTTTIQEVIKLIQRASHMMPLADSTKWLSKDAPGLVICGYTNKAVNNIKKKLPSFLQAHCITIHKLLEYAPVYYEVCDAEGNVRNTMRFEPSRNGANTLPHISTIIFEEASMIGTDLYGQVLDALPRPAATQFIFLGDIFQLPPVFGPSILGFKMSELPVIELTHVYRQALLSPIISLATAVRQNTFTDWLELVTSQQQSGQIRTDQLANISALEDRANRQLTNKLTIDTEKHGKVTIHPWKKRIAVPTAVKTVINMVTNLIEAGNYNPDEDQILCPFNKSFGTIELNKGIAQYLTDKRNEITYEVIARFQRSYWAVGDRVLVDRHDGIITKIETTIGYVGKPSKIATTTLNRDGIDTELDGGVKEHRSADDILNELDKIAEQDSDESKNLASHAITVYIPDLDEERKLSTAGEINNLLLSYVLTVHKSQGSEWRRVFLFLHYSNQTMCSRELLYTAITRAREELYVVCEGDTGGYKNQLLSGSNRAVIPGVTLAEKIEYFKCKSASMQKLGE